jgi:hypothetical protein
MAALFDIEFEALNLLLIIILCLCSRNLATWHNGIRLLSRTQSSGKSSAMAGLGDFHHIMYKCFMPAACVDSSLQLSVSAETIHTASHFLSLYQSTKHESYEIWARRSGRDPHSANP